MLWFIFLIVLIYLIAKGLYWPFSHLFHRMAPVALIAFVAISTILVAVTMKSAKAKKAAEQNERAKHEALESLSRRILATRNTKIAAQVGEIIKTKHRQREVGNGNAK